MGKWINLTDEQRAKRRERYRKRGVYHTEDRRKYRAEHREERNERIRKFLSGDLNRLGERKCNIRSRSYTYLHSKHSNITGYEIHHAFGYDDFKKFIYIPKTLHLQIHQLLRDHKIQVDSDHWMAIRDLVNSCDQYTYISV